MTNVLVIGIVGAFIILVIAAYLQSRKTRQELIAEMKEEILSNETAPVAKPAPVVAKVKPAVVAVKEIPAVVEALAAKAIVQETAAVKAAVQEMITTQEAPAVKPKAKRKRPAKKKPAQD